MSHYLPNPKKVIVIVRIVVYLDKRVGRQVFMLVSVRTPMASLIHSYKSGPAVSAAPTDAAHLTRISKAARQRCGWHLNRMKVLAAISTVWLQELHASSHVGC